MALICEFVTPRCSFVGYSVNCISHFLGFYITFVGKACYKYCIYLIAWLSIFALYIGIAQFVDLKNIAIIRVSIHKFNFFVLYPVGCSVRYEAQNLMVGNDNVLLG
jgi:hypothetical protein